MRLTEPHGRKRPTSKTTLATSPSSATTRLCTLHACNPTSSTSQATSCPASRPSAPRAKRPLPALPPRLPLVARSTPSRPRAFRSTSRPSEAARRGEAEARRTMVGGEAGGADMGRGRTRSRAASLRSSPSLEDGWNERFPATLSLFFVGIWWLDEREAIFKPGENGSRDY